MANLATTTYKVTSESRQLVRDLWDILQRMEVNSKDIWLGDLAKHFGIDSESKHISVRWKI
ncbi:hypothetical protein QR305_02784 [Bacteroides finegoldii]|uniref:Uncharacterized protein n=1 Tax=Bacteroides finegoldii CL09T03C10 TaxID=997888 RepID=K5CSY6_9BACE|nr:hypothetical protein HMPREF1057_01360 [Bacteroides finegoldii CL09T03C10]